jgi:hypothetical protein
MLVGVDRRRLMARVRSQTKSARRPVNSFSSDADVPAR